MVESEETKEKKGNGGDSFDNDTTRRNLNGTLRLSWLPGLIRWCVNAFCSSDVAMRTKLSSLTSSSFSISEVTPLRLAEDPMSGVVKQTAIMLCSGPYDLYLATAARVEEGRPEVGLRSLLRQRQDDGFDRRI